jgi:hypothetical protein
MIDQTENILARIDELHKLAKRAEKALADKDCEELEKIVRVMLMVRMNDLEHEWRNSILEKTEGLPN